VVAMALRVSSAGACPRRIELEAWGVEGLPLWEGSERGSVGSVLCDGGLWPSLGEHRPECLWVEGESGH